VLAPVDLSARAFREEIFGPVVAVVPFDDEADAVRIANDTDYGLSGSIWSRDLGKALRVARAVESGNLSRELAFVGAVLDGLLAVSSSRASDASSGQTHPIRSARSRTSLSQRRNRANARTS